MSNELKEKILVAIGEASMCWEHVDRAGIFDSSKASEIGNKLYEFVMNEIKGDYGNDRKN